MSTKGIEKQSGLLLSMPLLYKHWRPFNVQDTGQEHRWVFLKRCNMNELLQLHSPLKKWLRAWGCKLQSSCLFVLYSFSFPTTKWCLDTHSTMSCNLWWMTSANIAMHSCMLLQQLFPSPQATSIQRAHTHMDGANGVSSMWTSACCRHEINITLLKWLVQEQL